MGLTGSWAAWSTAGATTLVSACTGDPGPTGSPGTGDIRGSVAEVGGSPWTEGRVYLMRDSGLQTGRYSDLASDGTWRIPNVPPGEWQVAFHGPAHVPHDRADNPHRLTVEAGAASEVRFPVRPEHDHEHMIEIYVGDDFFQEQPLGDPNGAATVEVGTEVCWYNVSKMDHEVRGGPWGTSGVMEPTGSFIWEADRVGEFEYQCPHHSTVQKATLIVKEAEHDHG